MCNFIQIEWRKINQQNKKENLTFDNFDFTLNLYMHTHTHKIIQRFNEWMFRILISQIISVYSHTHTHIHTHEQEIGERKQKKNLYVKGFYSSGTHTHTHTKLLQIQMEKKP